MHRKVEVYTKLTVLTRLPADKDLIVGILSETGFDGFEEDQQGIHCYIISDRFIKTETDRLLAPLGLTYTTEQVPVKNWNEEWENNFQPVLVDNFCCIRASFHPAVAGVKHDIIITPRMSFGTGHHATTYLMIQQMAGIVFDNVSVLDFGTGTGILAILAAKMGAGSVLGIDNDKWSIENANDNIRENGCANIQIIEAGFIDSFEKFGIILANINRNVLLNQMETLSQHLESAGVLILSGLLAGDHDAIQSKARLAGLTMNSVTEREGWIALRLIHS